jgi:hypothetical protein
MSNAKVISWSIFAARLIASIYAIPLLLNTKYHPDTSQYAMMAALILVHSWMPIADNRRYIPERLQLAWDVATTTVAVLVWAAARLYALSNIASIGLAILPIPLLTYIAYQYTIGRTYNEQADHEAKYPHAREHRLAEEARKAVEWAKWRAEVGNELANIVMAAGILFSALMGVIIVIGTLIKSGAGMGGFIFYGYIVLFFAVLMKRA